MMRFCLVVCVVGSLLDRVCIAQPSVETVQAWFDKEWEQAQAMPDFGDVSIGWTLEMVFLPPIEDIRQMARNVEGHPDHPDKWTLESYQRRLKGEFDRYGRRLWVRGTDAWRFNSQLSADQYSDVIVTPGYAWEASNYRLKMADPTSSEGEYNNMANRWRSMWPELNKIVTGGLSSAAISGLAPGPVTIRNGKWRVMISSTKNVGSPTQSKQEFVGRWDEEAGRGFVESVTHVSAWKEEFVGIKTTFNEWQYVDALDRWIAGRAETFKANGSPDQNFIFDGAIADPKITFKEVVKIPDESRGDVVRGVVNYRRIENHRTGKTTDELTDGTVRKTDTIPTAVRPGTAPPPGSHQSSGKMSGWVRLLVAILVIAAGAGGGYVYWKRRTLN